MTVETSMVNDVTSECVEKGEVEEVLDMNDKAATQIKLSPAGGHSRQHSTNCTITVSAAGAASAISLAILHLQFSSQTEGEMVTVTTAGDGSVRSTSVREPASYDQPGIVLPVTNYLEYGSSLELLHLDQVRQQEGEGWRIKEEHLYSPEDAVSGPDSTASIQVQIDNWGAQSSAVLVFTAYRVESAGADCRQEEFHCHQETSESKKFCMQKSLVCDGVPNCGVPALPGPDEECGEFQWVFFLISFLLFVVIIFFTIFIISIVTNRYHMLYPHINIPLVKILQTDDDAEHLVH